MRKAIAQFTIYDDHRLAITTEFQFDLQYFNKDQKLGQQIMNNTVKFFQNELIKYGLAKQDQYQIKQ